MHLPGRGRSASLESHGSQGEIRKCSITQLEPSKALHIVRMFVCFVGPPLWTLFRLLWERTTDDLLDPGK